MVCILERVSRTHPRQQLRGTTEAQQTEQDEHLSVCECASFQSHFCPIHKH